MPDAPSLIGEPGVGSNPFAAGLPPEYLLCHVEAG